MSEYLQPYQIAFAGSDPPLYPHVVNDEFVRQKPAILPPLPPPVLPAAGQYTYVALDPKWSVWNPGNNINFRAIDTRRRMAMLSGTGDKVWGGIAQPLPLPTLGQTLQYTLYARLVPGFIEVVGNAAYNAQQYGLLIGENLLGAPTTSPFVSVQVSQSHLLVANPITAEMQCAAFANYNAANAPDQIVSSAWPLTCVRARIQQTQNGDTTWNSSLTFDVSDTGEGWRTVMRYTFTQPQRHFAFAQRSVNNVPQCNFCDYVRLFVQEPTDQLSTTGERQQLGSV